MTNLIAEQESIPVWCENCNCQGYIFIDDPEQPCFVVCKTCEWETSQVWCPKCGMGGGFVKNISSRPKQWRCPDCKTQYQLPYAFYEERVMLIATEDLSLDQHNLVTEKQSVFRFTPTMLMSPRFIYFLFQISLLVVPLTWIPKVVEYFSIKVEGFAEAPVLLLGALWFTCWLGIMKITNKRFEEWQSQNNSK